MGKATAAMTTQNIIIPTTYFRDIIVKQLQENSVVASLATQRPVLFENQNDIFFTEEPEGEYVGEGAAKSSATWAMEPKQGKIHKVQVTVRMTEEVEWADEDSQINFLDTMFASMSGACGRAIDYGMIHAINPLTRTVLDSLKPEAIALAGTQVTEGANLVETMDAFGESVLEKYDINGIALDRMFANKLRKARSTDDKVRFYPDVPRTLNVGNFEGLRAVTSGAVSGARLAQTATNVEAIIGNWDMYRWGIIREMNVTTIPYGDPDGLGDLKRYNQIAYRAEICFASSLLDPAAFAVLKKAASA